MSRLENKVRNTGRKKRVVYAPFLAAYASFFAACTLILFVSCRPNPVPKPRAYMRIALPEKAYRNFDGQGEGKGEYPFAFRMPVYAEAEPVPAKKEYPNTTWLDIRIPSLNATVYLSHISEPDLDSCITATLFFIQRHLSKSTGVEEREINEPSLRRYGWFYYVKGRDVASPYQFYLTDSAHHFVRGSLYINCTPDNDSLAPVLTFLKTDLDTLLSTWMWK